ncbi:MAG: methyltransferase [Spirochaetales bacterium]|nr:methyltransferase [Spirochaetales bacterium]
MGTKHFDEAAADWDKQEYRHKRLLTVSDAIAGEIPLSDSMNGLDFGCGTGLLGFSLIDRIGHMTFVDTSPGMIDQVRLKGREGYENKASWEVRDINGGDWSAAFDLIVSMMALHHVPDALGALEQLAKVLEPGGYLGLCDLEEEDGSFHPPHMEYIHRGFNVKLLEDHLTALGLEKVSRTTPFVNRKEVEGKVKEYPLFLLVYRKKS